MEAPEPWDGSTEAEVSLATLLATVIAATILVVFVLPALGTLGLAQRAWRRCCPGRPTAAWGPPPVGSRDREAIASLHRPAPFA